MATYRYKLIKIDESRLRREVLNSPTVYDLSIPIFIDIIVDSSSKQDLDEAMINRGYEFCEENPTTDVAEEVIQTSIMPYLDGYASSYTVEEHYVQLSDAIVTIQKDLDGYQTQITNNNITETQHYNQFSYIANIIQEELDGYVSDSTFIENKNSQYQINQSILQSLDGYVNPDLTPYVNQSTFIENKNAQYQINQSILQSLDGYVLIFGSPYSIGESNSDGYNTSISRSDHIHCHGDQNIGSLHAVVTEYTNGFMSSIDKNKLDNMSSNGSGDDWMSGLEITAQSSNDQTVNYTSGTYMINGIIYSISAGGNYNLLDGYCHINHYTALASRQRAIVLIYVDFDQDIKSIAGEPSSNSDPPMPIFPNDSVCLAFILIQKHNNGDVKNITPSNIIDCRYARRAHIDESTKVSVNDIESGFLTSKLTDNGDIEFVIENVGLVETLKANVKSLVITDAKVATANKDGTAATASMRTLGNGASQACAGNDSRLADDRTASGIRSATTVIAVSSATAPSSGQVLTAIANNAASWQTPSTTGSLSSSEVTATSTTTTTSPTDARINSMTLTPGAGNYLAIFSTSVAHSDAAGVLYVSIYVNGVQVAASERRRTNTDQKQNDMVVPLSTQAVLSGVGAGQAVEVKWRTSAATATAYQRTLTLLKIG